MTDKNSADWLLVAAAVLEKKAATQYGSVASAKQAGGTFGISIGPGRRRAGGCNRPTV
jgi:hypothetical protein